MEEKGEETACGAPIAATSGKLAPFLLAGQAPPAPVTPENELEGERKVCNAGSRLTLDSLSLSDSSTGYFRASFPPPNSPGDISI